MEKTSLQRTTRRRERLFLCLAALVMAVSVGLAFWFAPPKAAPQSTAPETPLLQLTRVDLNTADLETLCILPGVGEKRAQAILDYRRTYGAFRQVADAAAVPGLNENIVASWGELAYVC